MNKIALAAFTLLLALAFTASVTALEKVKIGSGAKLYHGNYLPLYAANEAGFAKQNGLELEHVPLRGGPALTAAIAGGHINIAINMATSTLQGIAAGLPEILVATVIPKVDFYLWSRSDSRFKEVKDIKGATLGVHMLRSTSHAYALVVAKAEGLENEVKFIGTGGLPETVAALRVKAIDVAAGYPFSTFAKLAVAGEVRPFVNISDYLPKEWLNHVVSARKDLVSANPEKVRRIVSSIIQGLNFIRNNPQWAIKKIMEEEGLGEKETKLLWEKEAKGFASTGAVERKAVENLRAFLIDYGIIPKEKMPPVEELFTTSFTQ